MGKKKKNTIEPLSLFDDSFFEKIPEKASKELSPADSQKPIVALPIGKTGNDSHTTASQKAPAGADSTIRLRGKKQNLRVTFPDGTIICGANATKSMIDAINAIGPERVASVGLELCHVPLVSRSIAPQYTEWIKTLADGWYLMTQNNNHSKYMQLRAIFSQLGIDAKVEMGDWDVVRPNTHVKKETKRKRTDALRVTFKDGTVIQKDSPIRTFQAVVEHLGEEKVRKTNIKISGRDILSKTKTSNSQLQLASGLWLTLPLSTKDKYRILRVLSSMTHIPFDIKIISNN